MPTSTTIATIIRMVASRYMPLGARVCECRMFSDTLTAADCELGPRHRERREHNEMRDRQQAATQIPGYVFALESIAEDVYRKNQQ